MKQSDATILNAPVEGQLHIKAINEAIPVAEVYDGVRMGV
jgi:hypothetical protein